MQRVLLFQEYVLLTQISLNIFGAQQVLYQSCPASRKYFPFLTSMSLRQEIRNYFLDHNWIVNLLQRKQVHWKFSKGPDSPCSFQAYIYLLFPFPYPFSKKTQYPGITVVEKEI